MLKQMNVKSQKLSAAVMTGVLGGMSMDVGTAQASNTLNEYLGKTSENVNSIPDAVAFICYLGGAALAGLGIVNLKQHVENPGNTPMKNGLAKLGFGGMLLGLPYITNIMLGTTSPGTGSAEFTGFQNEPRAVLQ